MPSFSVFTTSRPSVSHDVLATGLIAGAAGIVAGTGLALQALPVAVGALCALVVMVGILLRPVISIGMVLATWAPLLFVMKDIQVYEGPYLDLNLSRFMGAILIVSLGLRIVTRFLTGPAAPPVPVPLALYFVFSGIVAIGFLRTPFLGQALGEITRFVAGLLLMVCLWLEVRTPDDARLVYRLTLFGIVAAGALTLLLWIIRPESQVFHMTGITRAVGTFGHTNNTGQLGVIGIAFLLPLVSGAMKTAKRNSFILAALGCCLGMIVVTLSRSAILTLALLLAFWALLESRDTRTRVRVAASIVFALLVLGIGLGLFGGDTVSARLRDVPGLGVVSISDDEAGSGRVGIWKYHWKNFTGGDPVQILFGRGLGSSALLARDMYTRQQLMYMEPQGIHNEYLWLAVEFGVVGLAVYLAFCASVVGHVLRFRARTDDARLRTFLGGAIAYFCAYQAGTAFLKLSITAMGIRIYLLTLLCLALVAVRERAVKVPV